MKKIIISISLAFCFNANSQIINTVAGSYLLGSGYTGDGGEAGDATLSDPAGICFDAAGNYYIADQSNNVIRMVNTAGIISTVAGNNNLGPGYSGDGEAATKAQLSGPSAVAIDTFGNLYIADNNNSLIRMVNTAGIISTIAGDTTGGADNNGYKGDGDIATAAQLNDPEGLAFDAAGNLYISDYSNNVIRVVNTAGIISTFAGNLSGLAGYSGDGGFATAAKLTNPAGLAFDAAGNLYIADEGNNVIRKVNTLGKISTFAGNSLGISGFSGDGGAATSAKLNQPSFITFDNNTDLYIADAANNVIRMINTAGKISTVVGKYSLGAGYSGDGGVPTAAQLAMPEGIAFSGAGNLYIADNNNQVIREVGVFLPLAVNSATLCAGDSVTLKVTGATTYSWSPSIGLSITTGSMVIASPSVTTIYTVTGNSGSSLGIAFSSITINPLPTLTITTSIPNFNSICPNTIDTLTASGAVSYTWSPAGSSVAQYTIVTNTTTDYTLTGVDENGCKDTTKILISVFSLSPTVSITSNSVSPVCAGDTATLKAYGGPSFWWSTTNSYTDSIIVNPVLTSTYNVVGTDTNGCTSSANYTLTVKPLPTVSITNSATSLCVGSPSTLTASGAVSYTWSTSATTTSITVKPTTVDSVYTYSVTGSGSNGCTTTSNYSSVVNPLPTIVINGDSIICAGISTTLTANGASTYTWNSGSNSSSITITSLTFDTIYIVTGTDTNGCSYTATHALMVNHLPTVTVISDTSLICIGGTATLTASGVLTYTWDTGAITPTVTVSPLINTTYTVMGTDTNGCVGKNTIIQGVKTDCTDIEQYNNLNKISIYPNPNNGNFIVESIENGTQTLFIYDINGKLVLNQNIKGKTTIDAGSLNEGIYNIGISNNKSVVNKRLVIVK